MIEALQFAAICGSGLFAGAALYINLVEHPARMECGTELAATVFGPSYKRAAVMQVALAAVATISTCIHILRSDKTLCCGVLSRFQQVRNAAKVENGGNPSRSLLF